MYYHTPKFSYHLRIMCYVCLSSFLQIHTINILQICNKFVPGQKVQNKELANTKHIFASTCHKTNTKKAQTTRYFIQVKFVFLQIPVRYTPSDIDVKLLRRVWTSNIYLVIYFLQTYDRVLQSEHNVLISKNSKD